MLRKSEREGVSADLGRIVTAGDSAGTFAMSLLSFVTFRWVGRMDCADALQADI